MTRDGRILPFAFQYFVLGIGAVVLLCVLVIEAILIVPSADACGCHYGNLNNSLRFRSVSSCSECNRRKDPGCSDSFVSAYVNNDNSANVYSNNDGSTNIEGDSYNTTDFYVDAIPICHDYRSRRG